MFIEISNKHQLVVELKKLEGKEVAVHHICENCDDEQVAIITVFDDVFAQIDFYNNLFVDEYCTKCGMRTKFIGTDYITGIEGWN